MTTEGNFVGLMARNAVSWESFVGDQIANAAAVIR